MVHVLIMSTNKTCYDGACFNNVYKQNMLRWQIWPPNTADCQNLCVWCIYNQFFVKNSERRPDKNKIRICPQEINIGT